MARHETKSIKKLKKEMAAELRKKTNAFRKERFQEVLSKGNVETYYDISGIYCGLSARAKENAVYREILFLARCGKTAQEIVNRMEDKK